jgi:hypothetical protein
MRLSTVWIILAAEVCSLHQAHGQTVKSAVYIDLENYASSPVPTYSGQDCAGSCQTLAAKICTSIGYKYGAAMRMINTQLGGIVCFDTIGAGGLIKALPDPSRRYP